jgi:hypothetical protein
MTNAPYKMKLTAEEAKKFVEQTAEQDKKFAKIAAEAEIAAIESLIEIAARGKKRQVRLLSNFWINEGYSQTEKYKAARKILEENGYTVEFFYEERQFVNMYTVVRW